MHWKETANSLSPPRRILFELLGLLSVCLACFAALSFAASIGLIAAKLIGTGKSAGCLSGFLYLLFVGLAGYLLKRTDRYQEKHVVACMIGFGVVIKTSFVLFFPNLPLNADQALFRLFAERLADARFDSAMLSALCHRYDPLWASRCFPVHYLVHRLGGTQALTCLKVLNVFAASMMLCLTYAISRHVLPPGKRKWAVFLLLALPLQTFWVTDYSHHIFSSLYLLTFTWTACELAFGDRAIWHQLCLSCLATICLLFMAWQGGVDWIALGMAGIFTVVYFLSQSDIRKSMFLALFLLLVPACGRTILKGPLLLDRIWASDIQRQGSLLPAFMARGWCPITGGEYCARYEQLAQATPAAQETKTMFRLVASQIREEPVKTTILLPFVKTAKLFLVGYASNLEESLTLAHSPALPHMNWIRRLGTSFFLFWVLLGGMRLSGAKTCPLVWTPVLLLPILTWGAYVLAGETSPRYSVFCQPALAIIGAFAFCKRPFSPPAWRIVLPRTIAVLFLSLLAAVVLIGSIRLLPAHLLFANLQINKNGTMKGSGLYSVFEHAMDLPPGMESTTMLWRVPHGTTSCSFYPLACTGSMTDAHLEIRSMDGERLLVLPLGKHIRPKYEVFSLPPNTGELRVFLSRPPFATKGAGVFTFGYLLWHQP
ncbi:MAG: hypothetical protein J6Y19_08130 [Kiritimatiellae bacterium]|nr:hypothetical protein [Kiritimatiellia bacterium]